MATTRLADVVYKAGFTAQVEALITEKSNLRSAGLIVNTPVLNAAASGDGFITNIPFWSPITWSEANTSSDDPAVFATPGKIAMSSLVARKFIRNKPYQTASLLSQIVGSDPIAEIASKVAFEWAKEEDMVAMATLKGIALKSADMVTNQSITTGTINATNRLSPTLLITGLVSLGEASFDGTITTIVMHSDVANNLRINEPNNFVPASQTNIKFDTYMGYRVVISNNLTKDITVPAYPVYSTYLLGSGVFAAGSGDAETVIETSALAGNGGGVETLVSRRTFILHPAGHQVVGTPANGVGFSNAEISAAAAWNRVVDRKAVPVAVIKTNV